MGKKKTVWITKYALTQGIFSVEAELIPGSSGDVVYASRGALFTRDWVHTEAEARGVWKALRAKKIRSLQKQIAKLEAMASAPVRVSP